MNAATYHFTKSYFLLFWKQNSSYPAQWKNTMKVHTYSVNHISNLITSIWTQKNSSRLYEAQIKTPQKLIISRPRVAFLPTFQPWRRRRTAEWIFGTKLGYCPPLPSISLPGGKGASVGAKEEEKLPSPSFAPDSTSLFYLFSHSLSLSLYIAASLTVSPSSSVLCTSSYPSKRYPFLRFVLLHAFDLRASYLHPPPFLLLSLSLSYPVQDSTFPTQQFPTSWPALTNLKISLLFQDSALWGFALHPPPSWQPLPCLFPADFQARAKPNHFCF